MVYLSLIKSWSDKALTCGSALGKMADISSSGIDGMKALWKSERGLLNPFGASPGRVPFAPCG